MSNERSMIDVNNAQEIEVETSEMKNDKIKHGAGEVMSRNDTLTQNNDVEPSQVDESLEVQDNNNQSLEHSPSNCQLVGDRVKRV